MPWLGIYSVSYLILRIPGGAPQNDIISGEVASDACGADGAVRHEQVYDERILLRAMPPVEQEDVHGISCMRRNPGRGGEAFILRVYFWDYR